MTTRIYYEDAYQTEFEASVTGCTSCEKGFAVTLDRTAFYPEGGGQPCDLGTLRTKSGITAAQALSDDDTDSAHVIRVLDVQEGDGILAAHGEIVHFCEEALPVGTKVHGQLDWARRITNMREHSGEHILSGIICGSYGVNNVGFHMGKDCVTIDFDGLLTEEQIRSAQQKANLKVLENVEILAEYPDPQALASIIYRSKKEIDGAVRIVTIPGADVCACCGTHVRRTGEVGPICVTSMEHFKNGVRLTILIGEKALTDYAQKTENVKRISTLLSAKPEQTGDAVDRLQTSYNQLKTEYTGLRLELLDKKVDEIPAGSAHAVLFEQGLSPMEVRKLADKLQVKAAFSAVFSGDDTEGYKYVICGRELDIVSFGKAFNAALNGRGGGKQPMIQGSLAAARRDVEAYLGGLGLM